MSKKITPVYRQTRPEIFRVPWNKNEIDADTSNAKQAMAEALFANLWDARYQELSIYGIPIHNNCWFLIEHVVGSEAEKELALFAQTLAERWPKQPFGLSRRERSKKNRNSDFSISFNSLLWNIASDPINIPEVEKLIRGHGRTKSLGSGKKSKSGPGRVSDLGSLDLPLDIQFLILDCTRTEDTQNLLVATEWDIPNSYWRSRFPRDIIFEIEKLLVPGKREVDWQSLCLGAEKLLQDDKIYGLENRKRILRTLGETKTMFLSKLSG